MDHEGIGAAEWYLPGYGLEGPVVPDTTTTINFYEQTLLKDEAEQPSPPQVDPTPRENSRSTPSSQPNGRAWNRRNRQPIRPKREPVTKKSWSKVLSFSMRGESRVDLKVQHDVMTRALRVAPKSLDEHPPKLIFLWPQDYLPIEETLGQELEAFDCLRQEFGYPIYLHQSMPGYICASGDDDEKIREIIKRIRTKHSELLASADSRSLIYLVEPPKMDAMRPFIVVKQTGGSHKPVLSGPLLRNSEQALWETEAALIRLKNNDRLLRLSEYSLEALQVYRGNLRMRATFGHFTLDEYRVPRTGGSEYKFEEFREMLLNEKTRGRLLPRLEVKENELMQRCKQASHLLEPISSQTLSLDKMQPRYSVEFEFEGSHDANLRLEADFLQIADDYELSDCHWFQTEASFAFNHAASRFQVVILDFERMDWQLEIQALQILESPKINHAIRLFMRNLTFRSGVSTESIITAPKRRVRIPEDAPISKVTEKASISYQLKGSSYILELSRLDEYKRVPSMAGRNGSRVMSDRPQSTSWRACVFNPNWDNIFGEHAHLKAGQKANWVANLNTFCPSVAGETRADAQAGIRDFFGLCKEVAELLASSE